MPRNSRIFGNSRRIPTTLRLPTASWAWNGVRPTSPGTIVMPSGHWNWKPNGITAASATTLTMPSAAWNWGGNITPRVGAYLFAPPYKVASKSLFFAVEQAFGPPVAAVTGRNYAVSFNPGGDQFRWAGETSGWALKPIDFLHTQTDQTDSFWFGDGVAWNPTPRSFMMSNQWVNPGALDTAGMAAGTYNSTWLGWLKTGNRTTLPIAIVRIWQECNANFGFAWQQFSSPTQFINAWRNMASQVKTAYPAAKLDWNLNYNVTSGFGNGSSTSYDLYPGDDVVDIISIDGYEKNTTFSNLQSGSGVNLNNLKSFAQAHGKLVGVGETAAHNCDSSWITSWASFMDSLGTSAGYFSYYDQGLSNNGDNVLYQITGTDSCAANTLRAAWNASSFGQKGFQGTWTTVIPHS